MLKLAQKANLQENEKRQFISIVYTPKSKSPMSLLICAIENQEILPFKGFLFQPDQLALACHRQSVMHRVNQPPLVVNR
jgi:hypothetical protein